MKRTILLIALLVNFSFQVFSQEQGLPDPKIMAQKSTEQLVSKLKLSAVQGEKVLQILIAHNTVILKAVKENENNPEAMAPIAEKMNQASDAKIIAVLNADQRKAFQAYKEERKAEMQKRIGGQHPG